MSFYNTIIQPEVWGKVIFSQASVILSTGGGVGLTACITDQGGGLYPRGSASGGVCLWGVNIQGEGGSTLREVSIQMGSASKGGLHLGGVIDKPLYYWDTMGYNQQTGSTHPTGMHSCFLMPLALQCEGGGYVR